MLKGAKMERLTQEKYDLMGAPVSTLAAVFQIDCKMCRELDGNPAEIAFRSV